MGQITFDASKHKHGDVIDTHTQGAPPNSGMTLVVDASIWRSLASKTIGQEILELMPQELRDQIINKLNGYTGTYLDFMIMLSEHPGIHRIVTTWTGEYESTRRLPKYNRDKMKLEVCHTKIGSDEEEPEFQILHKFFLGMTHLDTDNLIVFEDLVERISVTRVSSKFISVATKKCKNYLNQVLNVWDNANSPGCDTDRYMLSFFAKKGKDLGEITDDLFSTGEIYIEGPLYFLCNDGGGRKRLEGKTTMGGRAIGLVDIAGIFVAMIDSGFLFEKELIFKDKVRFNGDRETPEDSLFFKIYADWDKQATRDKSGEPNKPLHSKIRAVDTAGTLIDGTPGLTFIQRLSGRALYWVREKALEIMVRKEKPGTTADTASATPQLEFGAGLE